MVTLHLQAYAPEFYPNRGQHTVGKPRLYEILYNLNQGFQQVLGQLQQLEGSA